MSSAAATSLISTPDRLLSFTAVALNRSPYLATLRDPALATTHLQAVSPRCQLIRGNLGVRVDWAVRAQAPAPSRCPHAARTTPCISFQRSIAGYARRSAPGFAGHLKCRPEIARGRP